MMVHLHIMHRIPPPPPLAVISQIVLSFWDAFFLPFFRMPLQRPPSLLRHINKTIFDLGCFPPPRFVARFLRKRE